MGDTCELKGGIYSLLRKLIDISAHVFLAVVVCKERATNSEYLSTCVYFLKILGKNHFTFHLKGGGGENNKIILCNIFCILQLPVQFILQIK